MMATRSHNDDRRIDLILEQLDALPTLSPVATRLLQIASAEDSDLHEIVRLIESDPALTTRILSLCRRASVGLPASVNTVHKAVVMLGLETVQAATLSVSVYEILESAAQAREEDLEREGVCAPRAFDRIGFWKHSIGVACAADLIARNQPQLHVACDEAFVAGLLHDIGKPMLELVLPRAYANVVRLCEARHAAAAGVERAVLGIDHHTAARRVAMRWGLPEPLVQVMWLHGQRPEALQAGGHRELVSIVTVAKWLCRHLHVGFSGDFDAAPPLPATARQYGIDASKLDVITPLIHAEVADRMSVLGLDHETPAGELLHSIATANRKLGSLHQALQQRSRRAADAERTLDQVTAFLRAAGAAHSLSSVFSEVVRSAAGTLGPGFYAIVHQAVSDEPWRITSFSTSGEMLRSDCIDPPAHHAETMAGMADPSQISMASISLLPWLADFVHEAVDLRRVKLVPLAARARTGLTAVLMHDRDPGRDLGRTTRIDALIAAWSAAVTVSAFTESARRTTEFLGETNRQLTEMQARLAEQESLARLGEMAAGAAHEMNNPLAIISGRTQLIAQQATDEGIRANAEAVIAAASNLTDLITSLRTLADPPPFRPRAVDASTIIAEAATRIAGAETPRVTIEPATLLADAVVDPDLLRDATAELISNGLQSSPDACVTVCIDVDAMTDELTIIVRDTGPGMTPETLQHAFDPFFSAKPAGRRTGLGLTHARRLVEIHGGTIRLDSSPGNGTIATISIPHWRSGDSHAPIRTMNEEAHADLLRFG